MKSLLICIALPLLAGCGTLEKITEFGTASATPLGVTGTIPAGAFEQEKTTGETRVYMSRVRSVPGDRLRRAQASAGLISGLLEGGNIAAAASLINGLAEEGSDTLRRSGDVSELYVEGPIEDVAEVVAQFSAGDVNIGGTTGQFSNEVALAQLTLDRQDRRIRELLEDAANFNSQLRQQRETLQDHSRAIRDQNTLIRNHGHSTVPAHNHPAPPPGPNPLPQPPEPVEPDVPPVPLPEQVLDANQAHWIADQMTLFLPKAWDIDPARVRFLDTQTPTPEERGSFFVWFSVPPNGVVRLWQTHPGDSCADLGFQDINIRTEDKHFPTPTTFCTDWVGPRP